MKREKNTNKKLRVGILGATGMVGQKFIILLQNHPWFEIAALGASEESAGKTYADASAWKWKEDIDIPQGIASMKVSACDPKKTRCDFVFSGLDASVAGPIESAFARAGIPVISNTKTYRAEEDVPLVVPEVNADHIQLIHTQRARRNWKGFIVTNPNCVAIPLALALKPIADKWGIRKVSVVSLQAISGAGYPGVASLDILDNVIPHIGGEEPKVEWEPKKLLGALKKNKISLATFPISAQCNRVAVKDGHFLNISFGTKQKTTVGRIKQALKKFKGEPQKLKLPSAPPFPIIYLDDDFRPQPRLDRMRGNGMSITVGRLRECPLLGYKMAVLGHNTIRGAAGAAILNAELLFKKGYLFSLTG